MVLVFANILNTFFSFLPIVFISKHALHNWFYTLSRTGVVIHKVSEIRSYTKIVFSVTSRSRTFRFGRNKELVLTNKQKQFGKINIVSKPK